MQSLTLALNLLLLLLFKETQAAIIFSTIPKSRNVSEHTKVTFECSTRETGINTFSLSASPPIGITSLSHLPNGDQKLTLTITDTDSYNSMHLIVCTAYRNVESNYTTAFLKIQGLLSAVGNLNHTGIVNCSVLITWTAPYTLQGVPIHYYTINITRHSDGAVVWSDTTNTTEYVISQLQLGETLETVVAAVNDVGTGATANITIPPPAEPSNTTLLIQISPGKVLRSGDIWHYSFYQQMSSDVCQISGDAFIETCLKTICQNITASIDDNGVINMMANLTRRRIYSISILIENNGIVVQESHPIKISTFDLRNISITYPVTNGQVCLSVEYVEGHDPNPSCFVMFRCIATAGYDMSTVINGTMMCVHLSPQVYTIVATDTIHDINTTTPPVIIYNVTVQSQMSSTVLPTESATATVIMAFPLLIIISTISAAIICIIMLTGAIITVLVCALQKKKKLTPDEQGDTAIDAADYSINNLIYARTVQEIPLYENAYEIEHDPDPDSDPPYEELPLKTVVPRNKIKVKECPAYGHVNIFTDCNN